MPEELDITYIFKDNDVKEVEKSVGIDFYSSPHIHGIGGVYKRKFKDFIVKEIGEHGRILEIKQDYHTHSLPMKSKGKFTTFTMVKINMTTFNALNKIARALNISPILINYSGLKDKRSISVQKISIKGNWIDRLNDLKIKNIHVGNIKLSKKSVKIGSHGGNNFTIVVRNIEPENINKKKLKSHLDHLANVGFPNLFGLQRFGIYRPNTHKVGIHLLKGDFIRAYNECVLETYSTESEQAQLARSLLKKNEDLEHAYNQLSKNLNYERKMIKHLMVNPGDHEGAFKIISPNLFKLFISSFQSHIFNRMISMRVKEGLSLFKPVKGDVISILDDDKGIITQIKHVYGGSYDPYLREAIKLNRAVIVAPIVGFATQLEQYPLMKKFYLKIMEQEEIDISLFKSEPMFKYELKGSFRALTAKPEGMIMGEIENDDLHEGKKKIQLEFSLRKGIYATMLLRELMK